MAVPKSRCRCSALLCDHGFPLRTLTRLGRTALLRSGVAFLIMLLAAPAWASCIRFPTRARFRDAALAAPIIIRARVLSKSLKTASPGLVDVQLDVERTLVGSAVGRSLTLSPWLPHEDGFPLLKEGHVYLILLQTPNLLYSSGYADATDSVREEVEGRLPLDRYAYPHRATLTDYIFGRYANAAEIEAAIISERCHSGQICPEAPASSQLTAAPGRMSLSQLLLILAHFVLGAYGLRLAHRGSRQPDILPDEVMVI